MAKPDVSVIMPVFNTRDLVLEAVRSILNQEPLPDTPLPSLEVLVVDDSSSDPQTRRILSSLPALDSRIRLLANRRSKGVSGARNTGMDEAHGKWFAFLDSDDLWLPTALAARWRAILDHPAATWVSGPLLRLYDPGSESRRRTNDSPLAEGGVERSGSVTPEAMANSSFHLVRGPLTARALGVDPTLGISDPAIALRRTGNLNCCKDIACVFLPHHGIHSKQIRQLCEQAGGFYIDPQAPYEAVIQQLLRSERLICSAMHDAIAAEALRIPSLPVVTHPQMLLSNGMIGPPQWRLRFGSKRCRPFGSKPIPRSRGD